MGDGLADIVFSGPLGGRAVTDSVIASRSARAEADHRQGRESGSVVLRDSVAIVIVCAPRGCAWLASPSARSDA